MELLDTKNGRNASNVQALGTKSKKSDEPKSQSEVPSIRLSPEQIEEIHADEYSLSLFYATRMEPLSLLEIKKQFPEPESKKAQAVLDRFLKVSLVHITPEGKYYSNYPENYINYSNYRYDSDLEARKDSKVFQIMKEQTGKSEFWKDKTYFSMDAFYSDEQSKELLEMFKQIKLKAKEFANQNAKKKAIKGLRFRRMKFYDMTFALLFAFLMSAFVPNQSFAGGNDPLRAQILRDAQELAKASASGGGNDPTGAMKVIALAGHSEIAVSENPNCGGGGHDPEEEKCDIVVGGGGHDPGQGGETGGNGSGTLRMACYVYVDGKPIIVNNPLVCQLQGLIQQLVACEAEGDSCESILEEIECVTLKLRSLVRK